MRILCVDDEALVRWVTSDLLRELGHEVVEAEGAQEALDRLGGDPDRFDLLLTDIMMPGPLDGRDLARLAVEMHPGLPILFFSGYSTIASPDADGARILPKPCSIGTLEAALAAIG